MLADSADNHNRPVPVPGTAAAAEPRMTGGVSPRVSVERMAWRLPASQPPPAAGRLPAALLPADDELA
jgi:hypothetical protein